MTPNHEQGGVSQICLSIFVHSELDAVTSISTEEKRGGDKSSHLNSSGEDSLVVEDGVAEAAEVEVVVLDARPHPEPGLEAARPGLQQSRLGEEKCWRGRGKEELL